MLAELAKANSTDQGKSHVIYEACPDRTLHRVVSWRSDLDYVLQVMHKAPVSSEPFKFSSFMCDIWPPELYGKMLQYYPAVLKNITDVAPVPMRAPCHFHGHCGEGISIMTGCHDEFDLNFMLSTLKKTRSRTEEIEQIIRTWTRVLNVLNSEEFADLVWQKLNVLEKRETTQVRIINKLPTSQVDVIHSDSPYTIATVIFMFPNKRDEIFEYGTCLYSPKPEFIRSMSKPTNCSHKVGFFPNSAFMFRTVPGKVGDRFYYNPKRTAITFGKQTRRIYHEQDISFPSWHSTPFMQYNERCEVNWRKSLFLTFNCTKKCWEKWNEGKYS